MYTDMQMYTITGKCGMTYIRIDLKDILSLLNMKERLEAEGWKIEGPIHVPDFIPEA